MECVFFSVCMGQCQKQVHFKHCTRRNVFRSSKIVSKMSGIGVCICMNSEHEFNQLQLSLNIIGKLYVKKLLTLQYHNKK